MARSLELKFSQLTFLVEMALHLVQSGRGEVQEGRVGVSSYQILLKRNMHNRWTRIDLLNFHLLR